MHTLEEKPYFYQLVLIFTPLQNTWIQPLYICKYVFALSQEDIVDEIQHWYNSISAKYNLPAYDGHFKIESQALFAGQMLRGLII